MNIAIVGATGAVGREMLDILESRNFPHDELRLLASERSAGTPLPYRGKSIVVEALNQDVNWPDFDIALFSAGGETSRNVAPIAAEAGVVVIDNSSAFRMKPDVALIVPEINGGLIGELRKRGGGCVIANPNCSTIIMLMAVTPIRQRFGVRRIVVSTYQAVSGAGAAAMQELERQTRDSLENRPLSTRIFPEPCAFNVFSHNTAIGDDGSNLEERKMVEESRKIWSDPAVRISATCVRVPVLRAHSESINLTLEQPLDEAAAREALRTAPGVRIVDDRMNNRFPTPRAASGQDDVLVGRIRADQSQMDQNGNCWGLDLFVSGDQLRKGAALNAIQIAELWLTS